MLRHRRSVSDTLRSAWALVIADHLPDRDVHADRPNQKRLAAFTRIRTAEGRLRVAVAGDLISRRAAALDHHPGRRSHCRSGQLQRLPADDGITCPRGRAGDVRGNSATERAFSSPKAERTARKVCRSPDEARAAVFETGRPRPHRVRGPRHARLTFCPRDPQQATPRTRRTARARRAGSAACVRAAGPFPASLAPPSSRRPDDPGARGPRHRGGRSLPDRARFCA